MTKNAQLFELRIIRDMSRQLLDALEVINAQVDVPAEQFMDGMASLFGDIEASDDEEVILVSLAIASQRVTSKYSAELARDVRGRELAALGILGGK
jgi:hypothetical protein